MKKNLLPLFFGIAALFGADLANAQDPQPVKLKLSLSLVDLPQQRDLPYRYPSMTQALEMSNNFYELGYLGIEKAGDALCNWIYGNNREGRVQRVGCQKGGGVAFLQCKGPGSVLPLPCNSTKVKHDKTMKKDLPSENTRQLRILLTSLMLAFGSTLLFSFTSARLAADLWGQLGLNQQEASTRIKESFLQGYLQHHGIRGLKSLAVTDRAAVTKDLATYAKQYLQSEAFKKEYLQHRETTRPIAPDPARPKEQIRQEQIEQYQETIKNTEEVLKQANSELKKIMEDGLSQLRSELKKWEDPEFNILQMMAEGEQQRHEYDLNRYKESLAQWEQKYPADSRHLVRLRLQEFLEKTKDVDYAAQLTEGRNGKKIFVNPDYEGKPGDWKKAFRAGKEATETVRALAKQWLVEIK
ncbi:hypothetical protein BH24BAC1_BH24BAC1_29840 [soil metagenome]